MYSYCMNNSFCNIAIITSFINKIEIMANFCTFKFSTFVNTAKMSLWRKNKCVNELNCGRNSNYFLIVTLFGSDIYIFFIYKFQVQWIGFFSQNDSWENISCVLLQFFFIDISSTSKCTHLNQSEISRQNIYSKDIFSIK